MKRIPRASRLSPNIDVIELFRLGNEEESIRLTQGEDFTCSLSTAGKIIRDEWARLYGTIVIREDGDSIIIDIDPGKAQR